MPHPLKRHPAKTIDAVASRRRPRIGLALGSGSARGLAHVGVIRAIEDAGIQIDCIAGTSMGALVGAVHAAGKLNELENAFLDFDWKKTASFFDVVLPRSGLLDGAKVSELVRSHIHTNDIEALSIGFAAVASDLQSGSEVVICTGDIIEAVRASVSVPGIFTPVRRNGQILVDGGLVNPVPTSVRARDGCRFHYCCRSQSSDREWQKSQAPVTHGSQCKKGNQRCSTPARRRLFIRKRCRISKTKTAGH